MRLDAIRAGRAWRLAVAMIRGAEWPLDMRDQLDMIWMLAAALAGLAGAAREAGFPDAYPAIAPELLDPATAPGQWASLVSLMKPHSRYLAGIILADTLGDLAVILRLGDAYWTGPAATSQVMRLAEASRWFSGEKRPVSRETIPVGMALR